MFHKIIIILVVLLCGLDAALLIGFSGYGYFEPFVSGNPFLSSFLILLQLPIIYFIVHKAYI